MVILVNLSISPLVAALRVHAVSGGSWRWVLPVWLLGMVPVGTNGWLLAQETWLVTPQLGCVSIVSISRAKYDAMAVATRASVLLSDILLVAATWYYFSRTSSVAEQLVRGVWAARPGLTTVLFCDGILYFVTISLLNLIDLVLYLISNPLQIDMGYITVIITVMMSISISHFLTCIREAAEYPIRGFSSQSLSFIDSQGNSGPRPWLSSLEFADIASASGGDNDAYALFDLEDDMDPRAEDNAIEESNDGIELEEFATAIHVVDKCMS